jgi:putative hemolysin
MNQLIFLVVIFVILEGFFSGSETGLVSLNRLKLRALVESGQRSAKIIQKILDNPNRMLSTTLVGTNVAAVSSSALFTAWVYNMYGVESELLTTAVMAPIILIFGEFIPKTIYFRDKDNLTYATSSILLFLQKLLFPVVRIVNVISGNIIRLFGISIESSRKSPFVTREEFKYFIKETETQGLIQPRERDIIYKIFDFGTKRTKQIMNNIDRLIYLKPGDKISDLLVKVQKTNHTRFPIKSQEAQDFVGLINVHDVIYEQDKEKPLSGFVRPISVVSEGMPIDEALVMLQAKNEHMAIVANSSNVAKGFFTVEDVLEEIIGEI